MGNACIPTMLLYQGGQKFETFDPSVNRSCKKIQDLLSIPRDGFNANQSSRDSIAKSRNNSISVRHRPRELRDPQANSQETISSRIDATTVVPSRCLFAGSDATFFDASVSDCLQNPLVPIGAKGCLSGSNPQQSWARRGFLLR